ncbi:FecR family protein [Pseudomonas sp. LRF_L74]|uniref:FecR family protein n=1 Tax=Pseudomonas sp. LRF_L74 TaxID=3369422 RepID=UPI003F62E75B
MLSDDDRDYADLLFVRTRSGDPVRQQQAWQALESWASDGERRSYLRRLARADAVIDQAAVVAGSPASSSARPARQRRRIGAVGALAACIVFLASGLWWLNPVLDSERYDVGVGEQREVHLSDGSRVVLNTATALQYASRLRSREVHLLRGEALFEVVHGTLRPFTVQSADTRVRVVGTVFSVRRLSDGSQIKVANGRVEVRVDAEHEPRVLGAGEQLQTARGRFDGDVRQVDAASVGNWSDGRLVFDSTPLVEALAELQRYRKAPIILREEDIGELKLTGSFSSREPERILQLLPVVFKLKVSFAPDGTAQISRR